MGQDFGETLCAHGQTDNSAALAISQRVGLGKVRHLATTDLWIQDKARSRKLDLVKILGTENPADVLTKYVSRQLMQEAISKLGLRPMAGRPACAPAAMGA